MRILALDVGTKTIGVAVSDELQIIASGLKTIYRKHDKYDIGELRKITDEYEPGVILFGVPYNADGTVGDRGRKIIEFSKRVGKSLKLPVELWDESFSTVNAEMVLIEADMSRKKRKKVIDKMAAVVILQGYLDSKSKKEFN